MSSIYFQLVGGASGDMLLSALINLGCPFLYLKNELEKLNIKFDIKLKKVKINDCAFKKITFADCQSNYSYRQIVDIIKNSKLDENIKRKSLEAYGKLFDVERQIHKFKNKDFYFHHLGKIDAIVEIVGFFICLEYLKINKKYVSVFPLDSVMPATLNLLKAKKVKPVNLGYETVTPTAAVLLDDAEQEDLVFNFNRFTLVFGDFGKDDYLIAYLFDENQNLAIEQDRIIKIQTNIDDMSPQIFEYVFEELFRNGAKDVYIEQAIAKKSRPVFILNVLCNLEDFTKLRDIIFKNTSTFGVRYQLYQRDKLKSNFIYKQTKFGKIKFRESSEPFKKQIPEYKYCFNLAKKFNIPLIDIYQNLK